MFRSLDGDPDAAQELISIQRDFGRADGSLSAMVKAKHWPCLFVRLRKALVFVQCCDSPTAANVLKNLLWGKALAFRGGSFQVASNLCS